MGTLSASTDLHPANRDSCQRMVAVIEEDCTGCNTCVDFCLVDCIEPAPSAAVPGPVAIREEECIGCSVCAKVCEGIEVNAIHLVSADKSVASRTRVAAAQATGGASPPPKP